ncbi:hypothetical protein PEPS_14400 [Persicobacter psychrovividus]|uniref:Uncharacterized protein n=2 Tax=Persicobacter psychrovividus TaxID=387638 RepID=A0ABN6L7G7_9BACT|nr:hypothetical protein PEPS_14400 [Persicobacter psychrovividus]
MNSKYTILSNVMLIGLFFILRASIMNWIFLFVLLIFIEIIFVFVLIYRLIFKKYRTFHNLKMTAVHISLIGAMYFSIGDYLSIGYLSIYHAKTINVFRTYHSIMPLENKVSGSWIVEDYSLKNNLTTKDYISLCENFNKLNPCQYENGYCYVEFGGFLKNSGGYYFKLNAEQVPPLGLGYSRINKTKKLTDAWGLYNY